MAETKIKGEVKGVLVVCPNPAIDIYAWLDGFKAGVPNRISKEAKYPGGKGIHVAMALAELEVPVTVAGFWGGESGTWIKKTCNAFYPNIDFIGPELKEWSRSCYTFKAIDGFDDTEILGTGPTVSHLDLADLLNSINLALDSYDMMALCGSWPKGSPDDGYAQLISMGKQKGVKSFVDCTGLQLKNALKSKPFGVHLNRKEITEFYKTDFNRAKENILSDCDVAAITDGSKGLYLLSDEKEYHAVAKVDRVISTIGSGDCLTAGVVAGYLKSLPLNEIAKLGAACGAANCLREDLGMLNRADVEALLAAQKA
ncbi:MAG: PfkB family carbohydrate kinase [Cyclobacteriaceae bacterium]